MPTPGSASLRLVGLVILCAALGCVQPQRSASFQLRQEIPFGPIAVSVNGWEAVGEAPAPLSSLRAPQGHKAIAVFVAWSGLDPYTEPDRQKFAEEFLSASLKLVDSDGLEYKSIAAMPQEIYHFSGTIAPAPRNWVVIFHSSLDSHGYTLRLSHPDPGEGSFDVAIVPLG